MYTGDSGPLYPLSKESLLFQTFGSSSLPFFPNSLHSKTQRHGRLIFMVNFLLLWQKASWARQLTEGRLHMAHCPGGEAGGRQQAQQLEQKAESKKRTGNGMNLLTLKAASRHLPPMCPHFPTPPNSWGPSVQVPKTTGCISHQTTAKFLLPFCIERDKGRLQTLFHLWSPDRAT